MHLVRVGVKYDEVNSLTYAQNDRLGSASRGDWADGNLVVTVRRKQIFRVRRCQGGLFGGRQKRLRSGCVLRDYEISVRSPAANKDS